ncbi:unnamed protein product [Peniophora sp. CBMAI 1063]|nr:unnamed protein product [Peniophora sp. CBMAI 1063]
MGAASSSAACQPTNCCSSHHQAFLPHANSMVESVHNMRHSACAINRLNIDCLVFIFYEDVLAEDPPELYTANWEWDDSGDETFRELIGDAYGHRGWALLRLSHVCRRWREVALSLSSLWASVVAQLSMWDPDGGYQMTLDRSRGLPLSFVLPDRPLGSRMERQLAEDIAQFGTIIFDSDRSAWPLCLSGRHANLLRKAIFITGGYPDSSHPWLDIEPLHMPLATHLVFDGVYMPSLAIGWHRKALRIAPSTILSQNISSFLLNLSSPDDLVLKICVYEIVNVGIFSQLVDVLRPYMANPSYNHLTASDCFQTWQDAADTPPLFSLRQGPNGKRRVAVHVNMDGARQITSLHQLAFGSLVPGQIRILSIENWKFDRYPLFPSVQANGAFHLDVLSAHVEELHYEMRDLTMASIWDRDNRRWGTGLLPYFILRYPETYPLLRRIYAHGGSKIPDLPWPSAAQLLGIREWHELRVRGGVCLEVLHLEGQLPLGISAQTTSLELLGSEVPVVDDRRIMAVSPSPSPPSSNGDDSNDDAEFIG